MDVTLRLAVNDLATQGEYCTLEDALKHSELDDDDLDVIVLTARDADGAQSALEFLFVGKVLGRIGHH